MYEDEDEQEDQNENNIRFWFLFATWEQCEHWELCSSAIFCSCPMTPMTGADRATFMAARGQWEAAHMAHGLRGALS